jgi:hypothetical protein
MKQKLYLIFFIFIICVFDSDSFAQSSSMKSSTFSAIGANNSKVTADLFIQQSIGQSSVIGSFKSGNLYFSQGFLTGISKNKSSSNKYLSVLAFPNSFIKEINFRFFPEFNKEVGISIYDMNGKMVYKNRITPINNTMEINLEMLSAGIYIVFFNCENRVLQSRIIKL